MAIYPADEWSAEGLLMMPEFSHVAGKNIAIVRGEGGRELLEPALKARDANVLSVVVYRREMPLGYHLAITGVDAIICTSYTSVDHLKKMVGQTNWPQLKIIPLIVVSERIKKLAHDLGFQTIWVAENASHNKMIAFIKRQNR